MNNQILKLGKVLSKVEQKNVVGGGIRLTRNDPNCDIAGVCCGPDDPCPPSIAGYDHQGGAYYVSTPCIAGVCVYS